MRKNAINVLLFLMLAGGMYVLWQHSEQWFPKPEKKEDAKKESVEKKGEQAKAADKGAKQPEGPKEPPKAGPPAPPPPPPQEPPTLIALGDDTFYNKVLLTTRGGGVQQVVLPKFEEANRLGKPAKDAAGKPVPLYLIPGVPPSRHLSLTQVRELPYTPPDLKPGQVARGAALAEPSYAIFHYPTPEEKYPDPRLGEVNWKVAGEERPAGGEHKVVFEAELGEPYFVKFRKTYTLGPKDYHVGLRVEIEKLKVPGAAKGKGQLRYQLSGPRGLPVEGEWYTTQYRNAVIGWVDPKGAARRQMEDAASIGAKRGGEAVTRGDNKFKYMGVSTQYFTSAAAVDDEAKGAAENPWARVRATTELPFDKKQDANQSHFDDITVRAASEIIDLEPGEAVAHSYLLYNGPTKVRLLKLMPADRGAVNGTLVDRYSGGLTLQTITDYRSDNMLGRFANFIYWTDLVIVFTNLMHWLLAVIHTVVPNWALCIVVLTVCVRLMLFYPSRKQTAMSMKMMEVQKRLQPEFDKLYEKYKDDLNAYQREKTRLMMQHGANPFAAMGGCLLLLAQMPIMMGLYFGLQESIFFRLDHFLWIDNLAAPDMLVWWTEKVPFVSTPEDLGSFIYLGPFFNLLPVLAVGLMLYQQTKMMPPSTDPQAEQQRMMMKIMMVMMAFFFYKVAAGLALYFIVSTGWGIIERQFIPKPKINLDEPGAGGPAGLKPKGGTPNGAPDAPPRSRGPLGRLREALQKKLEEAQKRADEQSRRQIVNDPNRPGGPQQGGSQGGPPAGGGGNRRDRDKKKRRK
jgi:YidC/Oxa1 family membrane protein insertase